VKQSKARSRVTGRVVLTITPGRNRYGPGARQESVTDELDPRDYKDFLGDFDPS
jgi:hypothetical protein